MANYADITNVTSAWQLAAAVNENVIWTTTESPIFLYPSNTHPDTVNTQGILLSPGERFLVSGGSPVYYKAAAGTEFCITRVAADHMATPGYDPADDMLKVKSVQKKFRDSFEGSSVDAEKWDVSVGTGGSVTVSGGNLVINSGTAVNAQTSITSKEVFTVPFRVQLGLTLSQRIANQSFIVEAISVDPVTLLPDGKNTIALVFDGTTATQAKYRVQTQGGTVLDSVASTFPTTAGGSLFEIEPFADECWFHGGTVDSTNARTNSYRRHQKVPDPNGLFKIRLRWLNGATAPASNTAATLPFLSAQDYAELTAEITAGRGQASPGQALGVMVNGFNSSLANSDNLFWNDSTTAQAANATLTGTARDTGAAAGINHRYSAFNAFAFADQAGTMRIECSNDNTTWRRASADAAVAANTPVYLSVPIMTRYYRAVYINGATLQTAFMLNTSFTAS